MSALYTDTDPHVEELQIKLLRQTPTWRKIEMFADLNSTARILALCGLQQRFPDIDNDELNFRFVSLLYGEEIAQKTLGFSPDAS